MAYEPTNWKTGDVVTSAKLNKLENGVAAGSGVLVVSVDMTADTPVLNKTWQEIHDAAQNGVVVLNSLSENGIEPMMIIGVFSIDATKYVVGFFYSGNPDVPERFTSNTADGYPVYVENL